MRAPAELANAQHEGVIKHAAFIKIGEEAGQRLVEHGRGLILHALGQALMNVPGVVVAVGHLGPDDFHHAGAGFHQAPGQQTALAEGIVAVQFLGLGFFLFQVKRVAGAAAHNQV